MADQETIRRGPNLVVSYVLFLGVAALLVFGFAAAPFRVSDIHVVGVGRWDTEVTAASGVEGRNIFTIRGASILDNLRRVPNLLVTGVQLSMPNDVMIGAVLRRPVLGWRTRSALYLVDKYGRLISTAGATTLVTIRDTTPDRLELGAYVNPAVIVAARYTMRLLPHAGIERMTLGIRRGIVLRSARHWTAILGLPGGRPLVKRIATLRQILVDSDRSGDRLDFVDLTAQPPYVAFH